LGCLTTSRIVKNALHELTVGVVKRGRVKWERHIVPIGEMISVYNTFIAIKEGWKDNIQIDHETDSPCRNH